MATMGLAMGAIGFTSRTLHATIRHGTRTPWIAGLWCRSGGCRHRCHMWHWCALWRRCWRWSHRWVRGTRRRWRWRCWIGRCGHRSSVGGGRGSHLCYGCASHHQGCYENQAFHGYSPFKLLRHEGGSGRLTTRHKDKGHGHQMFQKRKRCMAAKRSSTSN
jgi:hypothetical protein